jgi:hypothetical protein
MFGESCRTDATPRLRRGAPAQKTIGVARRNCIQSKIYREVISHDISLTEPDIEVMAIKRRGTARIAEIFNRFNISKYSLSGVSFEDGIAGSRAIPQIRHGTGSISLTSGSIGQTKTAFFRFLEVFFSGSKNKDGF